MLLWDARSLESMPYPQRQGMERAAGVCRQRPAAGGGRRAHAAAVRSAGTARCIGLPSHAGAIAALAWRPEERARSPPPATAACAFTGSEPQPQSRDYPWRGACLTASWNADGRVLAAGMQDGSVHLWNIASGDEVGDAGLRQQGDRDRMERQRAIISRPRPAASLLVWDFGGKGAEALAADRAAARIPSASRRWPSGPAAAGWCRRRATGGCCCGASAAANEPQDAHLLADDCTLLRFSRDGARLAVGDARGGMTIYDCTP